MIKLYSFAIVLSILFSSCKTASKAYQKGNYTDAVELGVKKLQKDPNDAETKNLVQQSYTYTVNEREDQIRILSNSTTDDRFDKIYQQYAALQNLYQSIHQYPAVAQMIRANDYSKEVASYKAQAADVHVNKANQWLNEGTKTAYREAYKEFSIATQYRPDDFELRKKRDQTYDAAITKVVVSPIQNLGGYQYGSSYQLQNFQRDIIATLYNLNNDFIKFYTEFDAASNNIEPDQILELNLSRISIGQPFDNKTIREVSKDVVVKEIVYKTDSVAKQYATVHAKIITTKRELLSQGDLFIIVRDPQGRIIWNDRFTGEHRWKAEFSTYTGDERALNDNDKRLLNQTVYRPPSDDQIMDELLKQIRNDLSNRLSTYYTRYQ